MSRTSGGVPGTYFLQRVVRCPSLKRAPITLKAHREHTFFQALIGCYRAISPEAHAYRGSPGARPFFWFFSPSPAHGSPGAYFFQVPKPEACTHHVEGSPGAGHRELV